MDNKFVFLLESMVSVIQILWIMMIIFSGYSKKSVNLSTNIFVNVDNSVNK